MMQPNIKHGAWQTTDYGADMKWVHEAAKYETCWVTNH